MQRKPTRGVRVRTRKGGWVRPGRPLDPIFVLAVLAAAPPTATTSDKKEGKKKDA